MLDLVQINFLKSAKVNCLPLVTNLKIVFLFKKAYKYFLAKHENDPQVKCSITDFFAEQWKEKQFKGESNLMSKN